MARAYKWLIAALSDDNTATRRMEQAILKDISDVTNNPYVAPFPYIIDLEFLWIPVTNLVKRFLGYDEFVELSIVSPIRTMFGKSDDYTALYLLLDRNLIEQYGMKDKYAKIVKHPYFNTTKYSYHLLCCFGDTPVDGMRCQLPSLQNCDTFTGCANCRCVEQLPYCKHTCYWHFIAMLLGAINKPRELKRTPNMKVRELLPNPLKPYIY